MSSGYERAIGRLLRDYSLAASRTGRAPGSVNQFNERGRFTMRTQIDLKTSATRAAFHLAGTFKSSQ